MVRHVEIDEILKDKKKLLERLRMVRLRGGGGGFEYISCSPLPGDDSHFD